MNIQTLGAKRWSPKLIFGQPLVNRVLTETWPRIAQFIRMLETDDNAAPYRSSITALQALMRQAKAEAYKNHSRFFTLYGEMAAMLESLGSVYVRRQAMALRNQQGVAREIDRSRRVLRGIPPLARRLRAPVMEDLQ